MIDTIQTPLKDLKTIYQTLFLSKNIEFLNNLQELFYYIYILALYYDKDNQNFQANLTTSAAANGAITGFTTGFIASGGELDQAAKSGVISGASAWIANDIGDGRGKELDWQTKAFLHGATQGIISELRGGSFRSGFISGVVGKVGGRVAINYGGDPIANATIIGVFGGIASEAIGGEFYEGAMRAAFVYLYNDVMKSLYRGEYKNDSTILKTMKNGDIVFAKRALGHIINVKSKMFDPWNIELVHEHIFYGKGGYANIGYSNGHWLTNEKPEGYIFSGVYHVNIKLSRTWFTEGFSNPSSYNLISNNCQDFADFVAAKIRWSQGN